jgi:hypothetical protein
MVVEKNLTGKLICNKYALQILADKYLLSESAGSSVGMPYFVSMAYLHKERKFWPINIC